MFGPLDFEDPFRLEGHQYLFDKQICHACPFKVFLRRGDGVGAGLTRGVAGSAAAGRRAAGHDGQSLRSAALVRKGAVGRSARIRVRRLQMRHR